MEHAAQRKPKTTFTFALWHSDITGDSLWDYSDVVQCCGYH